MYITQLLTLYAKTFLMKKCTIALGRVLLFSTLWFGYYVCCRALAETTSHGDTSSPVPASASTPILAPTAPAATNSPSVAPVCQPGSGVFTACFYSGTAFNTFLRERQDSQINFDWGWGSPYTAGPADQFSVRWEGDFTFNAGNYRFSLTCDDGARLYIDSQLVLDRWTGNQWATTYDVSLPLTAGTHRIKLEYYEAWGSAYSRMSWQQDSGWRDFYVSPSGNDGNDGRSPATAWRTTGKVAFSTFQPGDRIMFEGGQSFDGTVYFGDDDRGTSVKPIVVTSYGAGRATIKPGALVGLLAYNTAGIEVRNLNFSGSPGNDKDGVQFFQTLPGNVKLSHIRVDNVETSGFGSAGVSIFGWAGTSGYDDVRITNVSAHDNLRAGIQMGGYPDVNPTAYAHLNVYIGNCQVYNNSGVVDLFQDTGFGIFLANIDGAVVERNVVYNNGQNTVSIGGGPVGVMTMEANNVVVQNNEVHHMRTGSVNDGGGIYFDGGVTNSIIQYNYMHDNDGAGIALAQYSPVRHMFSNNTVRYNISQNDGRKSIGWSGILLAGNIRDSNIYNNTVYGAANASRLYKALGITASTTNFNIRNNVFITTDGMEQVAIADGQINMVLQNNAYWGSGLPLNLSWGYTNSKTLADFRRSSGQEMAGGTPTGLEIDPKLTAPGAGPTLNDVSRLSTLTSYTPLAGSPLIDKGLNLSIFGTNPGTRDFIGTVIPQAGAFDIGAVETLSTP